jgi:hypothetical protein
MSRSQKGSSKSSPRGSPRGSPKGSYLLIIRLNEEKKLKVGALGTIDFKPGYYIYVGSAMNGLIPRIRRHFKKEKKWEFKKGKKLGKTKPKSK